MQTHDTDWIGIWTAEHTIKISYSTSRMYKDGITEQCFFSCFFFMEI